MKCTTLSFILLLYQTIAIAKTMYVSAAGGTNVYASASLKSRVICHLWYGSELKTLEDRIIDKYKLLNTTKLKNKWAVIDVNNIKNSYSGPDGPGYILKDALTENNDTDRYHIPIYALCYYYALAINDGANGLDITYDEKTDPPGDWEKYGDTSQYDYNAPNTTEPIVDYGNKRLDYLPGNMADTFHSYMSLELVDIKDYEHKRKKNKYYIDTSHVETVLSVYPKVYKFSLPINKGKDKIVVASDSVGEAQIYRCYEGQIPYLNKYIIGSYWEDAQHYLMDKNTGKEDVTFETDGLPYFSPDGRYVLDFYNPIAFNNDERCVIKISKLDDKRKVMSHISVAFKSWQADIHPNSAFWISDREMIIKVYGLKNLKEDKENNRQASYHYQYIKLKIL